MLKLAFALAALLLTAPPAVASLVDERVAFTVDAVEGATGAVAVGDVDGDGHGDAVIDQDQGRRFHLVLAGGRGTYRIRGIVNDPPVAAGDVNGDGIGDLAVPSVEIDRPGVLVAVLLGRRTWSDVNLEHRAERDITVRVRQQTPGIGQNDAAVAAAGDMNGDGIGDLALTAASFDSLDRSGAPARMWVMFGRRGLRGAFDTARLGAGGFAIQGGRTHVGLGAPLAPAGDVDGDGLGDLLVGAPYANPGGVTNDTFERARGRAFVVYGRRDTRTVDLRRPAGAATEVATSRLAGLGSALAGPGDVDGDGLADVAVGAPFLAPSRTGAAYVLPGRRARLPRIDVDGAGAGALLRMGGAGPEDRLGSELAAPGDVDGDRRPDLVVLARPSAAQDAFTQGPYEPDELYLVHGGRTPAAFAPATVGAGVTVMRAGDDQTIGPVVASGTDLDSDGLPELLVSLSSCRGAALRLVAIEPGGPAPGLPLGYGTPAADALRGGAGDDRLVGLAGADVLEGRAGTDCLVGGDDADRLSGGSGRDTLLGDAGDDVLHGGSGGDLLRGGDGNDVLALGAGSRDDDRPGVHSALGEAGDDELIGGPDTDELSGGEGSDRLVAGAGADRLAGGDGQDVLDAGAGADQVDAGDRERDVVRCGPGRDVAIVDRRDAVSGCETVHRIDRLVPRRPAG